METLETEENNNQKQKRFLQNVKTAKTLCTTLYSTKRRPRRKGAAAS